MEYRNRICKKIYIAPPIPPPPLLEALYKPVLYTQLPYYGTTVYRQQRKKFAVVFSKTYYGYMFTNTLLT
jgi:hypothetical protein